MKQAAYLYTDTRKLHYGTVHDISAECLGLLQSRYTVAGAAKAESNMGSMDYPVNNANVQISLTEQPRGAISSYYFPGSPSGWISPGASLLTTFPAKNAPDPPPDNMPYQMPAGKMRQRAHPSS